MSEANGGGISEAAERAWEQLLRYYSEEMGKLIPDSIVLVQPSKDPRNYADSKYLCDKVSGFQCIVMTETPHLRPDKKSQLPGQRFFSYWLDYTLVLGADVTHPGLGALHGCPSIAAVVGSVDGTGGKFFGLDEAAGGFTRDDQQHDRLGSRANLCMMDHIPDFKLTAIVVTKRHHTRFYPTDKKYTMFKNENCMPERHGHVDCPAPATHDLCHSYVRATLAVSYASPAYYADRLCDRGRQYLREFFASSKKQRDSLDHFKKQLGTQRRQGHPAVAERNTKVRRPEKEVLAERSREAENKKWAENQLKKRIEKEVAVRWNPVDEYKPGGRFVEQLEMRKKSLFETMY
ncbi:hypothetical protein K491DRAFT_735867 [Lophiostoma macrostomum CBS 122681]|uniref:Piwi domain-containing protein n=1 Tax=Lophiostoma macrostomum CBS 122681 TaxID=1314788 RepID=A0A6A6SMM3_9PLEO|nr:hypothetical protein K491DRAFT_735867 [Lophiostoma macrostomum CBS 122681]